MQAHGRTANINRTLSFELVADDIAALIKHLEIEQADVMGYSLGGGVALRTAIRHHEVVRKLVISQTMDTYSHVKPGMGDAAATTLEEALS